MERKVKETVIAFELKRRYSDDEILGWYLNTIGYGNFAFGVEAAAQRYFGVSAKDLTLAQSAMLAGIPQAPGRLTPVLPDNLGRAKARQILELRGSGLWEGDLSAMRRDRPGKKRAS